MPSSRSDIASTSAAEEIEHLRAALQAERQARLLAERRLMQAQSAERMLDTIMEHLPEGIAIAETPDARMLRISRYGQELTENDRLSLKDVPLEAHGSRWAIFYRDGVTPGKCEDLPIHRATRRGEVVRNEEWVVQRPSGERVTLLCNAVPMRDDAGNIAGGILTWRDISDRKRLEERQHILASARCLLWYADVWREPENPSGFGFHFHFPSLEAAHRFLPVAVKPGESFMSAWYNARLPEDRQATDRIGLEAIAEGRDYTIEYRCCMADGSLRWIHEDVQIETLKAGESWRAVGVCTDVSQTRLAEEERRYVLSTARCLFWSESVEVGEDGSLRWELRFFDEEAAKRLFPIPGRQGQEYIWAWHKARLPEDRERTYATADACIRRGKDYRQEFRMRSPDGSLRWMQEEIRVQTLEEGKRWRVVGVCTDITDRKEAETIVRDSEERFRATFEQAAVGMAHVGLNGDWIRVNQRLCEIVGYDREELLQKTFQDITFGPDLEADLRQVARLVAGDISSYSMEKRYLRKDGSLIWANLTASVVRDGEGLPLYFISVVEDISERKEAEEAIRHLNARLRRAMTETHHRVRNNLQILSALLEVQMTNTGEMLPREQLLRFGRHVETLAEVHTLLMQQAQQEGEAQLVPVDLLLHELLPLYERLTETHAIHFEAAEVSLQTRQATALALVTNELVSNALKHGKSAVTVSLTRSASRGCLEVADDGPGFAAGFDATRSAHTGLFLVSNLVTWDMQGKITFATAPTGGGRATVEFPCADGFPEEKW